MSFSDAWRSKVTDDEQLRIDAIRDLFLDHPSEAKVDRMQSYIEGSRFIDGDIVREACQKLVADGSTRVPKRSVLFKACKRIRAERMESKRRLLAGNRGTVRYLSPDEARKKLVEMERDGPPGDGAGPFDGALWSIMRSGLTRCASLTEFEWNRRVVEHEQFTSRSGPSRG